MNITVVGDTLLDVDIVGTVERMSPDGPVPVVDVQQTQSRPGGAGLVAAMLRADGHDVRLVTALSDDAHSKMLRGALGGIAVIAGASGAPTPVKSRLRAAGQTIARIDEGCGIPPLPEVTADMLGAVLDADVILVADYGRGLAANPRLRQALQRRAVTVPLIWDPHRLGAEPVRNTAVVTPNRDEARAAAGITVVERAAAGSAPAGRDDADVADAAAAASVLLDRWHADSVIVTLGEHGALIANRASEGLPLIVPAHRVDAPDACGAGDRFAASLAAELGLGTELPDAVERASAATAAFLRSGGVAAAQSRPDGAAGSLPGDADALSVIRRVREHGGTVVATGGCFDLLHAGHARTLAAARRLGDCLVVCLNSDASVSRLKGAGRPIIVESDRVDLLLALECVDAVIVFDEDTPEQVLRSVRPDIWVKGGDYTVDSLPEAQVVRSWGGQTVTVPYFPARSTTTLASALALVG
ncbi:D-glycero-beta-D-manno-heptose 1-phosphate adenylyltransferase [Salinibacterium sp. ZJ454]|uniref:D-glycero-beta-D-manno-heptose 1-phosphate adenylyltransferase n=1 Tax=Salinibacterium sp. ZJ454 TaxID=2708339 RepID=UPI0014244D50|nr:D-glycero-beta-D-manno-heptose 1-phosphate adenylyltransferase [Salinibacterium sp. ZJ454]